MSRAAGSRITYRGDAELLGLASELVDYLVRGADQGMGSGNRVGDG